MSANQAGLYYAVNALGAGAPFVDDRLKACNDRHRIDLVRPTLQPSNSLLKDALASGANGLVIEMVFGWATRAHLQLARAALHTGMRVWFYWPKEQAVEFIDRERCASHWRLWFFVTAVALVYRLRQRTHQYVASNAPRRIRPILKAALNRFKLLKARMLNGATPQASDAPKVLISERLATEYEHMIDRLIAKAKPNPLSVGLQAPSSINPIEGTGVYLRTDYWAPINTGGSYGHTCYVAKELAATTQNFVCFMSNRFGLLDEMGLAQRVMTAPSPTCDEMSLIRANGPYYEFLSKQMSGLPAAYIYERICLGNFVGARLSQELGIPYIVEYNGSEISMRRSFDSGDFEHERFFLKAEEAAFKQATLISVISEPVRDDLLRRGISPDKILVNPNGVDLQAYAPREPNTRALLRRELGFKPSDRVVGFIGTFGGWHGIDVLAEALPLICQRDENTRFLLIGDGNFKHLVDDAIARHNLGGRVICTGRVPHQRGAKLLSACDIYASPHSSHMVDSRFFGSPTKLFEYMAMGGGIVGSDLEQIGEVLSPALRATSLSQSFLVDRERSILCTPGSVGEFVEAVVFLARHPDICEAIGRNARAAAEADFSWRSHISRLWRFAANSNSNVAGSPATTIH
jgi:glycosyltransferase involved in cell wall biosynthesis